MTSRDQDHHRPRRAVLVLADRLSTDLARRRLPAGAAALLKLAEVTRIACGGAEIHVFTPGAVPMAHATVHHQVGRTFAARFENAVEELHGLGFSEIVAIGVDCPGLCATDIATAFAQLQNHRLVLGPDHRGGCYLIAFRSSERELVRNVTWRRNGDCAQLARRCSREQLCLLGTKQDVDSWSDLNLLALGFGRLAKLARWLVAIFQSATVFGRQIVDLAALHLRARWQLPPPARAL
ncbi:MAG: DUF2064 domain-containing protein [Chthoniobacterales bacterium]